jgi:putative membrane protein
MKKLKFSESDLKEIREAVKEAEKATSGEIKVAFIRESSDYARYELFFAILAGFIYMGLLLIFSARVESFIMRLFWEYSHSYTVIFFGVSPFVVITMFYLLANLPVVDRIIVPRAVQKRKVVERAVRYFAESGIFDTRDRTGILIFLSFLERRVELIADKGINARVPPEKWKGIVDHITAGIRSGTTTRHLVDSVLECGKLLSVSDKFPIKADDSNELDDDVSILES